MLKYICIYISSTQLTDVCWFYMVRMNRVCILGVKLGWNVALVRLH